jgi:phosphate:Na+ symporter
MNNIEIFITICVGIILFLFGLKNFSNEIEEISGDKFRKFLSNSTKNPISGVLIGALITGIIQSSTATTVISISLVNSGVISSLNSLGLVFGANLGASITSQLIALKLTNFAPFFILGGFLLGLVKNKYTFLSKSIFYFGLVFFSLNLISQSVEPLKSNQWFIQALTDAENPFFGILIGFVFTAIVNSSSVTIGILIILAQQNIVTVDQALPIVLGAKIGTTLTTLIASVGMDSEAKRTAIAHFIYNVVGVILFLPLLNLSFILKFTAKEPGQIIANALLIFNLISTTTSLIFINNLYNLLLKIVPDKFNNLKNTKNIKEPTDDFKESVLNIEEEYLYILKLYKDSYVSSVIGLESSHETLIQKSHKISNNIKFLTKEIGNKIRFLLSDIEKNENANVLVELYQLNLKLTSLANLNSAFEALLAALDNRNLRLSLDMILSVREVSQGVQRFITAIELRLSRTQDIEDLNQLFLDYKHIVNKENTTYLKRLMKDEITSGNFFIDFVDINNKIVYYLNDFIITYEKIENKIKRD